MSSNNSNNCCHDLTDKYQNNVKRFRLWIRPKSVELIHINFALVVNRRQWHFFFSFFSSRIQIYFWFSRCFTMNVTVRHCLTYKLKSYDLRTYRLSSDTATDTDTHRHTLANTHNHIVSTFEVFYWLRLLTHWIDIWKQKKSQDSNSLVSKKTVTSNVNIFVSFHGWILKFIWMDICSKWYFSIVDKFVLWSGTKIWSIRICLMIIEHVNKTKQNKKIT